MENRTFRADGACECLCGVVLCWAASPSPMRSNHRPVLWRFFLLLFSRALVPPPSCARASWWVVEFSSPKCVSEKEIPVMGKTIAFQRNHFRDPTPPDAYQTVRIGRGNRGTPNRWSCTPDRIGRAACRCCRSRKENRWWMVVLSRYQWRIVFLLASWKVLEWQFAAQRLCVPFVETGFCIIIEPRQRTKSKSKLQSSLTSCYIFACDLGCLRGKAMFVWE